MQTVCGRYDTNRILAKLGIVTSLVLIADGDRRLSIKLYTVGDMVSAVDKYSS